MAICRDLVTCRRIRNGDVMPRANILSINHRALIASSPRKRRFRFLHLPEDLQDRIVKGLDSGDLTLRAAEALVRREGLKLSIQAISKYYRAVRRRRDSLLIRAIELHKGKE